MSQELQKTIPLREAYAFAISKGLASEVAEIREMEIEWDKSYTSSVRRGFIVRLLQHHNLMEEFIESYWKIGRSAFGEAKIRRLLSLAEAFENYNNSELPEEELLLTSEESSFEFALESHLRDFLAKDLAHIESGLRLYRSGERSGIEYPVEGGRIDILAVDKNENLVVIELKLSQGRNKVLGQLLYYMGWVDANLSNVPCRGIVIASEISKELATAVSRAPGVKLYIYKMSFSVEPV